MNPSQQLKNSTKYAEIRAFACQVAEASGSILMAHLGRVVPQEKGQRDLITAADHASQNQIHQSVQQRYPDHKFIGEESTDPNIDWKDGEAWIVDPLDGTMNFVHGLPTFSVSIAYCVNGIPQVGVVHDPWLRETYSAVAGQGAWCGQLPIHPSHCDNLDRSLFVHSFPSVVTPDHVEFRRFQNMVQRCSTRRLGSAALNLCYVGSGRLDGYWASTLKMWDIAAGILIAQEAGATCSHLSGKSWSLFDPQILVTSTPALAQAALPLLQIDDDLRH